MKTPDELAKQYAEARLNVKYPIGNQMGWPSFDDILTVEKLDPLKNAYLTGYSLGNSHGRRKIAELVLENVSKAIKSEDLIEIKYRLDAILPELQEAVRK